MIMKKRLIVLFTCLLAGAFTFSLFAQDPYTGSVSTKTQSYWWTYLVCDGAFVDYVEGVVEMHKVEHFQNGELKWTKYTFTGNAQGYYYPEVSYTIKSQEKENLPVDGLYTWTAHMKSDDGGHFMCSFIWDMVNGGTTVDKAWCK